MTRYYNNPMNVTEHCDAAKTFLLSGGVSSPRRAVAVLQARGREGSIAAGPQRVRERDPRRGQPARARETQRSRSGADSLSEPTQPGGASCRPGHLTPADFTHPLCAVCISLSPAASKQSDDSATCHSAAAFTARHLLPACLPSHCWLCEAGR